MIKLLEDRIPIRVLCTYFSVSPSSYYFWRKQDQLPTFQSKPKICEKIREKFSQSRGTYGSPRIYQDLKSEGHLVSENTVAKYMQEMGLDARLKKKFRVKTTHSDHNGPIAPRILKVEKKETLPSQSGQVFAGDITYLPLGDSFLYLAVVIDLFNRKVVGWSMSRSLESTLVVNALKSAFHEIGKDTKIIFHSDRGSQYASEVYRDLLEENHIIPSMSRKGNCYDNSYVESWFKSLKYEWLYRNSSSTEEELRSLVFEYIETWYNTKRRHSSLDYLSPKEYQLKHQIV